MRRARCQHCRALAAEMRTWDVRPCALGHTITVRLCVPCDIALNLVVLEFVNVPGAAALVETYGADT